MSCIKIRLNEEDDKRLNELVRKTGKTKAAILKAALYGIGEDYADEMIMRIGCYANIGDINAIKEVVHQYVIYRTGK